MALTEKMKVFAREYYKNGGNGTDAYLVAYDTNNRVTASREAHELIKRSDILEYIKALNVPQENKAISEREKKRKFLWDVINDQAQDMNDRLRSMDLLNKMDSEYTNININKNDNDINLKNIDIDALKSLTE